MTEEAATPTRIRGGAPDAIFRGRLSRGPRLVPWALVVPALTFAIAVHWIAPMGGAWYAFTDWRGVGPTTFVGLRNFQEVLSDPLTRNALINTLKLAAPFVVVVNVLGLGLALGLNRTVKSRNLLRSIFFVPVVASPLAVSYIWRYIFDYNGGLNTLLAAASLESWQRAWLGDPRWALRTIFVLLVWQWVGLIMVIYLAGLQGIPEELDEAALVDGAGVWMRFRRVTFPLLAPAFTICTTLSLIHGLRVFDQVMGLTNGGPVNATETLSTQVWKQAFVLGNFGYSAALALILTGLIAVLSLTQLMLLRMREARI